MQKGALLFPLLFLSLPALWAATSNGCDGSGNCYIYPSATGSGSGANWTNAYTGFGTGAGQLNPSSMTRGVTYWIASGNYGGVTFNSPASGTSVITVEAATASNHGSAADWNNSFSGQALFSESAITTSYWTFNGQTRNADWKSGYLIKFWNQADGSGASVKISGTNLTFSYVELQGTTNHTGDAYNDNSLYMTGGSGSIDNLYVGYSYLHDTGNTQVQLNNGTSNNMTFEYDYFYHNHTGHNGTHDEAFSIYPSHFIVRNSVFQDICGTGEITDAGANTPNLSNWEIYGNLFFWDAAYASTWQSSDYITAEIQNGIVAFLGEVMSGHIYFYNNTISGFYSPAANANGQGFSTLGLAGNSGFSGGNVTVVQYNNLWYGSAWTTGDYAEYCSVNGNAACTHDYDAFFEGDIPSGDFTTYNETHGYIASGSANPFVNLGASTIAGFELVSPDPFLNHAGTSLSTPYNTDMLGVTRGANGTWDRGALQTPGTSTPPAPPTGLTATVQ